MGTAASAAATSLPLQHGQYIQANENEFVSVALCNASRWAHPVMASRLQPRPGSFGASHDNRPAKHPRPHALTGTISATCYMFNFWRSWVSSLAYASASSTRLSCTCRRLTRMFAFEVAFSVCTVARYRQR